MKSLELTKPITTESLLKEFESRFNQTMDLTQFTKEELEDYANHVRTRIHEITQNTHFGRELKDDQYQKNQMMLDIINQAITEYGSGEMKSDPKTKALVKKIQAAPGIQDKDKKEIIGDIVTDAEKVQEKQSLYTTDKEGAGWIMANKDKIITQLYKGGIQSVLDPEDAVKAISDLIPDVTEKQIVDIIKKDDAFAGESAIREGVEEQSELILAAKDMMDKVTSFLEDLASMKTEGMLELADRIRDEMGADKADAFLQKIQPAIEQAEATLTTTRQELDNGVRILTGEEEVSDPMGADDTMATDMDADLDSLDSEGGEETDEFGASDAEAGGTEPEGREQRESREVFEASNRLYSKLAGK